ncbi:MAG: YhcH/YjgK/YiaL family protein [Pseudomonadota bacterium]|nr:YhcH/YjgK/YiaL family protein [Pseudomonadota bacterium]
MILGDLGHIDAMVKMLPAPFKTALRYLKETDFGKVENGTHEVQGTDIVAIVQDLTTKPVAAGWPEVHRKHIDVQFLIHGRERIGVAKDTGRNKVTEDRLEKDDVLFYQDIENESTLEMRPGSFAIFFPSDVHRPGCQVEDPEPIRKVVIKINVSLLLA